MPTRRQSIARALRTLVVRVAWFAVAVVIALGAAGLATAANRAPGSPARAELTWRGDEAARPALEAAEDDLEALLAEVERLGTFGRGAIASLAANDLEALQLALDDGTASLATIATLVADVRAELGSVPGIGQPDEAIRLSDAVRTRYDGLVAALATTGDLGDDWAVLTVQALGANRLTTLLSEHDTAAAEAARLGSRERYRDALEALSTAEGHLAEAKELRDELAKSVDVVTLSRWLERSEAYDAALRSLYQSLIDSRGRVTDAVREAFAAEREARERLPGDTRALVVIMAEVARGGLNQAVIEIEEARGALADALAGIRAPSPAPGTTPLP